MMTISEIIALIIICMILIIMLISAASTFDWFYDYQQRKRIKLSYDAFCSFYCLDKNQFEFSNNFPFPILYIEKGFFDNKELIVFENWRQAWAARKFMKNRKKEEEKAARNEESAKVTQKFLNTQREKLCKLYEEAEQQKKKALEENKEILLGIHEEIF